MIPPLALATEDELSEAVGIKLLAEHPVLAGIPPRLLRKNGFGYLRSKIDSWRKMSSQHIVIVLTDLDKKECPLVLLKDWLGAGMNCPPNLLLRIAVREIESWLLADHQALIKLIGNRGQLPTDPDMLPNPKQYLLKLVRNAPRAVREDLIRQKVAISSQGIGYNRRLVEFVKSEWIPERAATRSPSLSRARLAIRRMAETLTS